MGHILLVLLAVFCGLLGKGRERVPAPTKGAVEIVATGGGCGSTPEWEVLTASASCASRLTVGIGEAAKSVAPAVKGELGVQGLSPQTTDDVTAEEACVRRCVSASDVAPVRSAGENGTYASGIYQAYTAAKRVWRWVSVFHDDERAKDQFQKEEVAATAFVVLRDFIVDETLPGPLRSMFVGHLCIVASCASSKSVMQEAFSMLLSGVRILSLSAVPEGLEFVGRHVGATFGSAQLTRMQPVSFPSITLGMALRAFHVMAIDICTRFRKSGIAPRTRSHFIGGGHAWYNKPAGGHGKSNAPHGLPLVVSGSQSVAVSATSAAGLLGFMLPCIVTVMKRLRGDVTDGECFDLYSGTGRHWLNDGDANDVVCDSADSSMMRCVGVMCDEWDDMEDVSGVWGDGATSLLGALHSDKDVVGSDGDRSLPVSGGRVSSTPVNDGDAGAACKHHIVDLTKSGSHGRRGSHYDGARGSPSRASDRGVIGYSRTSTGYHADSDDGLRRHVPSSSSLSVDSEESCSDYDYDESTSFDDSDGGDSHVCGTWWWSW